ncbi:hypothetical protein JKP88DRAFT_354103 [Tribonema minus]|uniref:Uncharacterized protein n=1 Tax=Tribonema minus TaxID=303371 RepID=A0A835Z2B1_9STRA|nr:hypothetical protein JKP88DRAFT_354103 [Tribonema minus]
MVFFVRNGAFGIVIGQALRHPWKECAGVEIVPALHDIAAAALAEAQRAAAAAASAPHSAAAAAFTPQQAAALRALAPCALHLGDILTPCRGTPPTDAAARADVVFCYCSTWPAAGDLLTGLSFALAAVLRKGALVVTTDRRLASEPGAWEFALRATREGVNAETGGASVAYIWEVTQNGVGLI